jgi:hypothetical protein
MVAWQGEKRAKSMALPAAKTFFRFFAVFV